MTMTSPSELPEGKWPWSIVPSRAFGDKRLKDADRRVLGAMCAFVNRAGVCWPAMETMRLISGHKTEKSIFDAVQRLKAVGYVRQLRPKDYQETASGWKTNRYQVLWLGDEAKPSREDIASADRIRLATDPEPIEEVKGGLGGERQSLTHAISLASAYATAVERATGQFKRADQELGAANRLANKGFSAQQVQQATQEVARAALARRAGVPALADVERHLMVETPPS
jgi:hypothetical protein